MRMHVLVLAILIAYPLALSSAERTSANALPAAVDSYGNRAVMDNGDFYEFESLGHYVLAGNIFSGAPPDSRIITITDDFEIVLENGDIYTPMTPARPYTFQRTGNYMEGWQHVCPGGHIVSAVGTNSSFAFLTSCGDVISVSLRGRIGLPLGVEQQTWTKVKARFE